MRLWSRAGTEWTDRLLELASLASLGEVVLDGEVVVVTADGRADFDPAFDKVVQLGGRDIGLIGVDRRAEVWFLEKLYLLPAYQRQAIGDYLLRRLIADAHAAGVALRLTVLEVNSARRFYERHGFVLTHTISPRQHMEWRAR